MSFGSTRKYTCAALVLATAIAVAAVPANAAQFTPGNIVVATAPTTGVSPAPVQVTLTEYTSSGASVQSYAVPNSGSPPFGSMNGPSTTSSQINFDDLNNQLIYISTTFVNSTAGGAGNQTPGYLRVNASSGAPVIDAAVTTGDGATDNRGVEEYKCRIYTSSGTFVKRTLGGVASSFFAGNCRWLARFGSDLWISSGASGGAFTGGPGVFKVPLLAPDSTLPSIVFATGASTSPMGLFVADANTVYVTFISGGGVAGVHKYHFNGSIWVDDGANTAVGTSLQVSDVTGVVNGGNVTLYVVTNTSVWRVADTLASTDVAWQGAAGTEIVTGLSRGRSVAIVPAAQAPQSYNVNVTNTGSGFGSVVKNPPTGPYAMCSTVQLTATANVGSLFTEWLDGDNGDASLGVSNPLNLVVDGTRNIKAKFDLLAGQSILTLSGVGNGSVDVTPGGTFFFPGGPYNIVQPTNTNLQVDAFADANWIFDRWTGSLAPAPPNDESPSIPVTLSANGTLTANFKQLYQVRTFTTGNGSNAITGGDPNDGNPATGVYLYRQGKNIQFTATAGNVGSPATPWTFVRHADAALVTLSTNATYTFTNISAPLDDTAEFVETPLNANPQAFTGGNVIVGTVKDFTSPGQIQLREYNSAGQLVQPPVDVPLTGTPSGVTELPTSGTTFDINFDVAAAGKLYLAANHLDGSANPTNRVGFVRTVFSGGAHTFDLREGAQINDTGRGVTANGNDVYFSLDSTIRRWDIAGAAVSTLVNVTPRMVEMFNSNLYFSTATTATSGTFANGAGIYEVTDPAGTPGTPTQIVQTLGTGGAGTAGNILNFAFADANNLYVCFTASQGYANVHKFFKSGGVWVNQGNVTALGVQFGRGVDVRVSGNNVRVWIQSTTATSEGSLAYVDDTLDNTLTWSSRPVNTTVPRVSRGRAVAVVPASAIPTCATCLGDVNGNSRVDGVDSQGFVGCVIAGGPLTTPCACADMNGSGGVTTADIGPYVTKLLGTGDPNPSCP